MRDALQRRLPWSPPVSKGRIIVPQERDVLYCEAIQRHGPLSSTYLYEFTRHRAVNRNQHQKRLTLLANEDRTPHGGPYLVRPWQQFQTIHARSNAVVVDLAPAGRALLRDRGLFDRYAMPPSGPYLHRFMTAAITASLELAGRDIGVRYVSQGEILARETCPEQTRLAEKPLALRLADGASVVPDQLFGLEYPVAAGGKRYRFFALEADRGTEPLRPRDRTRSSIVRKLAGYLHVRERELFRERWGIPNLLVLVVTTSRERMTAMIELLADFSGRQPGLTDGFLFATATAFGRWWQAPPIMTGLLMEPWTRVRDALLINNPS